MPTQSIEQQLATAEACHEFNPADPWLALCVRHLKHIIELEAQCACQSLDTDAPEDFGCAARQKAEG